MQKFNELMSREINGVHLSRGLFVLSLALFMFSALASIAVSKSYSDFIDSTPPDRIFPAYVVKSTNTRSCFNDKSFENYYLPGIKNKRVDWDRFQADQVLYASGAPTCGNAQFICSTGLRLDCNENKNSYKWKCLNYTTERIDFSHDRKILKKQQIGCSLDKQKVNGECSTTELKGCKTGVLTREKNTKNGYTWVCEGQGGGSNASCSATVVNGSCSTTKFKCKTGDVANTSDGTAEWTWICAGKNSGTNANCSLKK